MSVLHDFAVRMGDNTLVLGHRVSEWCGHAPVLEEDIALANTALDLIGQTQLWLGLAGDELGKSADDLAFHRDAWDFHNALLCELPNGDFGQTLMRQYLFDQWHLIMLAELKDSKEARVAEIADKAIKEVTYHVERSRDTVIGLGDGTEESHSRMQTALDYLYPYIGELFITDEIDKAVEEAGIAPKLEDLRDAYDMAVAETMAEATLKLPESRFAHQGGRSGRMHTEHMGHILTEMQWLQRAYPDATW